MHRNWHHIFLNGDSVVKIALAVQKLPEPNHGIIDNLFLRLQFTSKHDMFCIFAG